VFFRDRAGTPRGVERRDVPALAARGEIDGNSRVFDTSVTSARDWRDRFETNASESWVGSLLSADHASQSSSRTATKSSSARNA
jgi:hypothetical protein